MKTKIFAGAASVALLLSAVAPATAHGDGERFPESKYRHDVMEHFKYAINNLVANAKGDVNHKDQIPALANIMAQAATMTKASFQKDTRGIHGMTEAKDAIWENWEDFAGRLDQLEADTKAFAEVANSTDNMGEIMGAFKNVGRHCKSCHDKYKED
ncbi:MAG: cytochrome c [Alphaproteobacteria bacterium]|nr:cytochrome c [Alphaproteobacteria bacterium]